MKVKLTNVRLAFSSVFKATSFDPSQPAKYSGTFIFEPDSAADKAIKEAMEKVAQDKWAN
jgi:hypothetical protein